MKGTLWRSASKPTECSLSPGGRLIPTTRSPQRKRRKCVTPSNRFARGKPGRGPKLNMSWVCEFSADAEKDLKEMPKAIQQLVARVMTQMETNPYSGQRHSPPWRRLERRVPEAHRRLPA